MAGRGYNGWSAAERYRLGELQVAMLKRHPEYRQTVCKGCGGDRGIVQHLEDYEEPLRGIIGLCCRCHVAVHERFKYPDTVRRYVAMLREGYVFPRGKDWKAVLQDMFWSSTAFNRAVVGPDRGSTILDRIIAGEFEHLGPRPTGVSMPAEVQLTIDMEV
jgi:hypothetical protein